MQKTIADWFSKPVEELTPEVRWRARTQFTAAAQDIHAAAAVRWCGVVDEKAPADPSAAVSAAHAADVPLGQRMVAKVGEDVSSARAARPPVSLTPAVRASPSSAASGANTSWIPCSRDS